MRSARFVVVLLAGCIASACGPSDTATPSNEDGSAVAAPPNDDGQADDETATGTGSVEAVAHRLLVDDASVGEPWTVAVVTPEEVWKVNPDAEIAIDQDVLLRFTLAESSSPECRLGEFAGLAFDTDSRTLFPVIAPAADRPDGEVTCFDDDNPHTIIVAVAPDRLPSGEFSIWVSGDEAPAGVVGNVVRVSPGELRAPDSDDLEFPVVVDDQAADIPVGETRVILRASTRCGLDRLGYVIDGTQWVLAEAVEVDGGVPLAWVEFERGQEIDLVVERVGPEELLVSARGSDVAVRYERAVDEEVCA